jgi:hypothetical protein
VSFITIAKSENAKSIALAALWEKNHWKNDNDDIVIGTIGKPDTEPQ